MVEESRLISLAKSLIATNSESPPGREAEVAAALREHMEAHGVGCKSVGDADRPNLIFYSHDYELGELVIHGHMDTVPVGPIEAWDYDPFAGEIVDGRLYGRGSCDMKGPLAALAESMIQYSEEGHETPLIMLATSDEESGCSGAEAVATSGILKGIRYGVCAEPTSLDVLVGEKGMLWTKLIAHGRSAHGSRPEEGLNAIELCMKAIRLIKETDFPYEETELMGAPTLNLGLIEGGIKINVVPDWCDASLDMRIVKGQTIVSVLEKMRSVLSNSFDGHVEVEYVHGKDAVLTPTDAEIVDVTLDAVESKAGKRPIPTSATYGTDCSVLQPKIGILNVICGPGSIEQAHQPNEFIEIKEMTTSVEIYLEIARHFDSS
jgi:succinyl-diaminopimelate desuccinylase